MATKNTPAATNEGGQFTPSRHRRCCGYRHRVRES